MAIKWAGEGKEGEQLFTAFGMFYRLLAAEASGLLEPGALTPLPQVSSETCQWIPVRISLIGDEQFSREAIDNLEAANPEPLQMAHGFVSGHRYYARTMLGFRLALRRSCASRRATVSGLTRGSAAKGAAEAKIEKS